MRTTSFAFLLMEEKIWQFWRKAACLTMCSFVSQNHGIMKVGEDLLISLSSIVNPVLPSRPLNHVPKCHNYLSFNTPRVGDSTTSPGSQFVSLTTLSGKKFFLIFHLNLSRSNLRPFALVFLLVFWDHEQSGIKAHRRRSMWGYMLRQYSGPMFEEEFKMKLCIKHGIVILSGT